MLELEELPLLVLCKGLSTMVSVLLRSGLLQEDETEAPSARVRPTPRAPDPSHTDREAAKARRILVSYRRQG